LNLILILLVGLVLILSFITQFAYPDEKIEINTINNLNMTNFHQYNHHNHNHNHDIPLEDTSYENYGDFNSSTENVNNITAIIHTFMKNNTSSTRTRNGKENL
jgi:hypothetical protein